MEVLWTRFYKGVLCCCYFLLFSSKPCATLIIVGIIDGNVVCTKYLCITVEFALNPFLTFHLLSNFSSLDVTSQCQESKVSHACTRGI